MFEWLTFGIFSKVVGWIGKVASYTINRSNDKNYATANTFYANDPCKGFHSRRQNKDTVTVKEKLEKEIKPKREKNYILQSVENTFLPFTREYIPTTRKKVKPQKDIYSEFFKNLEYREEFTTRIEYINDDFNKNSKFELLKDIVTNEETIMTFIDNIASNVTTVNSNNTAILLLGDIGSGKTAFFSKIMYDLATNNPQEAPIFKLPINIDFEDIIKTNDRHGTNLNDYVVEALEKVKSKINSAVSKDSNKSKKTKKYRVILFLDNLDIVYQKFCEDYFISPLGHKFIDIFLTIVERMKERDFCEHSLVLFCGLRGESVNALKNRIYGTKIKLDEYFVLRFEIVNKSKDEIKAIIEKRLKLAADICDESNENGIDKKRARENYEDFKNNTKINFEEINNISSEGLRNTIDLFFRVTPSIFTKNVFKRFFIDDYYIRKLHFLGDSSVYTQAKNGIFNLFLNNTKYRYSEKGDLSKLSTLSDISSERLTELSGKHHIQTYWLKYFILFYLYNAKHSKTKNSPDIRTIISFFSPKNTEYRYEENLVRLVLLGLSEARHGKILDIILTNNSEINTFELSERGEYILENIVWNFDYLSVAVEDYWLQFPEDLFDDYEWMFSEEEGYCHIKDEKEFQKKRKDSLSIKIKKVKLFLEILELSYEVEKEKIKTIYIELEKKNKKGLDTSKLNFSLPIFKDIRKIIYDQIIEYAKICALEGIDEKYLKKNILTWSTKSKYKTFFRNNYGVESTHRKARFEYHKQNQDVVDKIINEHIASQPAQKKIQNKIPGL